MNNDLISKYEILTAKELKYIKDQLSLHNIPLFRLDKEKKLISFPKEQLSLITDNEKYSNLKIYIPKNFSIFIEEFKSITTTQTANTENNEPNYVFRTPKEAEKEMIKRISEISKMTYKEKVNTIETYNQELQNIQIDKENGINENTAQQIVNVGNDVGLIAKVTMFESIQKIKNKEITHEYAKIENQEITETTKNIVTTIVDMLSVNTETQKVFDKLSHYSDGGIMAHSNRVFISYVNFMVFYNNLINRRHLVHKIRTSYTNKYKKFYEQIETMFHKNGIYEENLLTLEDCIDNGIKTIEEKDMKLYSIGALLHDIGKIKDLDYFEGSVGRDYERIKKHLFNSYALVSQTSEYPLEVILTVALHHEYYGLGYGPYENLYKLKLKKHPDFKIQRIMTYDTKAINECDAFAYFPAKMLEIIDVYDALIDPSRKYRGGTIFTPEKALNIMREDFIEKHVKLDPILYDIFVEFLSNSIEQDMMSHKLI